VAQSKEICGLNQLRKPGQRHRYLRHVWTHKLWLPCRRNQWLRRVRRARSISRCPRAGRFGAGAS